MDTVSVTGISSVVAGLFVIVKYVMDKWETISKNNIEAEIKKGQLEKERNDARIAKEQVLVDTVVKLHETTNQKNDEQLGKLIENITRNQEEMKRLAETIDAMTIAFKEWKNDIGKSDKT